MYIMTIHGWRALRVHCTPLPTSAYEAGGYVGKIPSQAICQFYNSQKQEMKFFDDGVRMQYGKPDRHVETDNAIADHPIPYPPAGF